MIRIVVEVSEDGNGVAFQKYVQACGATPGEVEIGEGADAIIDEYLDTLEETEDVIDAQSFARN